jgi:hypothetical protein
MRVKDPTAERSHVVGEEKPEKGMKKHPRKSEHSRKKTYFVKERLLNV